MQAIYVMKWAAISLLLLIQIAPPAFGEEAHSELVAKRMALTPEAPKEDVRMALEKIAEVKQKHPEQQALAERLLQAVMDPSRIEVGTNPYRAILQTLAYKNPSKYVAFELSGQSLPDASSATVASLQRFYDKLNHTEKPLTVFKNNRNFVLVQPSGLLELFADDTQFVVEKTEINGAPVVFGVEKDFGYGGNIIGIKDGIRVRKQIVMMPTGLSELVTLENMATGEHRTDKSVKFKFADSFTSDFKDMFEVRGWKRAKRGTMLPATMMHLQGSDVQELMLSYRPVVGDTYHTHILATTAGGITFANKTISFTGELKPAEKRNFAITIYPSPYDGGKLVPYKEAKAIADDAFAEWKYAGAEIKVDNPKVQAVLDRALLDLFMLRQQTRGGTAIAAGTPWFAAPFGRDQLITSYEMLAFRPEMARDVLRLLGKHQGTKTDAETAERPGKIMHELRVGEMAQAKEIPFRPYFGTVDATPLWVTLLGKYYDQFGDIALVKELEPNLKRALQFLDASTTEGKGYLVYGGNGKDALSNQGWKDSSDSVSYSNGELAKPPIALCEVQAYLYEAWKAAGQLESALGNSTDAQKFNDKAAELKQRFNRDFWTADGFIALGLDGDGKQIDVLTSNAGQVLISDLIDPKDSASMSKRLLRQDMNTGFGIRTLSSSAKRYFPNSYHNGSVWPHDVALCVRGIQKDSPDGAAQLAQSLFDAAQLQPRLRFPELYGGYDRQTLPLPIPYPVACEPQAWSAASPFMLLTACTGFSADACRNKLSLVHPRLPSSIKQLVLKNLNVNSKSISLEFNRSENGTTVRTLENPSKLSIEVIP